MVARRGDDDRGRRSLRVELAVRDFEMLDEACDVFGVGKSELVRRLVRASVDVGPALSVDAVERIEALTGQVRIVGRNLMQVLRAAHRGEAVGMAGSEPVWRGLQEMIAALDGELSAWTEASGAASSALRQRAGLVAGHGYAAVRYGAIGSAAAHASTAPALAAVGATVTSPSTRSAIAPARAPVVDVDGLMAE